MASKKNTIETEGKTTFNFGGKDYKVNNKILLYGLGGILALVFYKVILIGACIFGLYKFIEYKQKHKNETATAKKS